MDERQNADEQADPAADYGSVDAWADAMLARHRSQIRPDPEPRWHNRELPRARAFLGAGELIGMIVLCVIAFALLHVAFNSG